MCQTGNPQGTRPCRQSGCAGQSCRLRARHTWPGNQWQQCHSTGFWSRKYSLKNHWKVKNALCSGCGVTLSPLWIPRTSPVPSQGDRKEIFWRELLWALLMAHLDDLCAVTFLRYQLMLSWDPVLQSNSFLQDLVLQQLPEQCSFTSSENTTLYSCSGTPSANSTVLFQHRVPRALSELIKHHHSLLCSCTQWP